MERGKHNALQRHETEKSSENEVGAEDEPGKMWPANKRICIKFGDGMESIRALSPSLDLTFSGHTSRVATVSPRPQKAVMLAPRTQGRLDVLESLCLCERSSTKDRWGWSVNTPAFSPVECAFHHSLACPLGITLQSPTVVVALIKRPFSWLFSFPGSLPFPPLPSLTSILFTSYLN